MKHSIRFLLALSALLFLTGGLMADTEHAVRERKDVPERYRWNLESVYPDMKAVKADMERVEKSIPGLTAYSGKLTNADVVLEYFQKSETVSRLLEKIFVYCNMKFHENEANNEMAEWVSKVESLSVKYSTALSFVSPELLELPETELKAMRDHPRFKNYRMDLDSLLRQKPHTLTKAEEAILAGTGELAGVPGQTYQKVTTSDIVYPKITNAQGAEVELSPGMYQLALEDNNRDYRKRAFLAMYGLYDARKNTLGSLLNSEVKKNVFYARTRRYPSVLESSLYGDNIPPAVFDNLIRTANANLKGLHRYVALRRKALKLDKVHIYDMYVGLLNDYETNFTYDDGRDLILKGLTPLGPTYLKDLEQGFNSRWVDVYETKHKHHGGYHWGSYDTPPFVLMNYNDSVDSMMTLAHEMGHAMHSFYSHKNQPYPMAGTPIFIAEVASTANEMLMIRYLIDHSKNTDEKLFYINHLIEMIRGTFFTQVMYSEFERATHDRVEKGEALSAQSLSEIWKGLMLKYYGPDFELDELATLWWSRIPHFYDAFYVYKYATSIAASYALTEKMTAKTGADEARKRYLDFLAAGSSDYPINVLKNAGVDMSSPAAIESLCKAFNSLVSEMETLLKKEGRI